MTEHRDRILRIERSFRAPIDRVFDAWTRPDVMRRWLHCAPDWETPTAEVDLRVGGRLRIVMREPNGSEHGATGEYLVVERPHRLVFTWTFDSHPDNHQLIELRLAERDGLTTVVMINSAIGTEGQLADQRTGWHGCLDNLEPALGVAVSSAPEATAERAPAPIDLRAGAGDGPLWGTASEDLNVTLLSWRPGDGVPEHGNDALDVLVVVLAGSGTATVDGRDVPLAAPQALLIPKRARRAIVAGPAGLRYLSIHRRRTLEIAAPP